ncbi:MAG: NADH-quinone oxidoreductase subunit J [Propionibacteriaceae bacterium]|jgi:NADH-quinone oxidoreductase subunit J|nr:NADH-quinone oxidoreductase subunit J [Propionibacteriaceae bacterium]
MFTTLVFWVAAPLALVMAVGTVVARKVVHSAICLCGMMVALGALYATLEAPFLFVAQILVYTGSIVMLFLFTMMLIGIDTQETLVETIRGQRVASGIAIGALLLLLVLAVGNAIAGGFGTLEDDNAHYSGNAQGLAVLIFTKYVFAFEAAAALVLTAALAAMVLAHTERRSPKVRQRESAAARIRRYAESGTSPAPEAGPGVYARANSIAYPALLPDGSIAGGSVSPTLLGRGDAVLNAETLPALVTEAAAEIAGELPVLTTSAQASSAGDPAATTVSVEPAPDDAEGGAR